MSARSYDLGDADTHDRLNAAAHQMARYGGGFAQALAECWTRADGHNKRKLLESFGDLFEHYADMPRT